jgi:hypothetical protein
MAAFESQKKSSRLLVLAPSRQAGYGTALVGSKLTAGWLQRFDGSGVPDMTPSKRTDKEMSGKGTEFTTNQQTTGWDTKFGFKSDLDARLAGWAFAFAMGKDTVTGSAAPYTHAMSFDESTTQAVATTLYVQDTAAIERMLIDMAVSDLTLTIPARGACTLEANFLGTGIWTNGALGSLPALDQPTYLLGSDCTLTLGPVGSLASLVGRHMSSTIKLSTGVMNHTAPGAGLYGIFPRTGLRKFSFETTIAAKDTDDISTLLENDTACGGLWAINSGASAQLNISIPAFHLKANKLGFDGNMVVWQISGDETSCLWASGAPAISAQAINAIATFLST